MCLARFASAYDGTAVGPGSAADAWGEARLPRARTRTGGETEGVSTPLRAASAVVVAVEPAFADVILA